MKMSELGLVEYFSRAEMVDKELLHYIEARRIYIITDQGYICLKKGEWN